MALAAGRGMLLRGPASSPAAGRPDVPFALVVPLIVVVSFVLVSATAAILRLGTFAPGLDVLLSAAAPGAACTSLVAFLAFIFLFVPFILPSTATARCKPALAPGLDVLLSAAAPGSTVTAAACAPGTALVALVATTFVLSAAATVRSLSPLACDLTLLLGIHRGETSTAVLVGRLAVLVCGSRVPVTVFGVT